MASKRMTVNAPTEAAAGQIMRFELNRRLIVTGPLTIRPSEVQTDDQHVALAVTTDPRPNRTYLVLFDVAGEASHSMKRREA
jgi:hypothetical protein